MKRSGFTLIELVIVIVILGILAVVAAPKFINLKKEAVIASLDGMEGAVRSAVQMAHAKAQLSQNNAEDTTQELSAGVSIRTHYGYPRGSWQQAMRYLLNLGSFAPTTAGVTCTSDWCGRGGIGAFDNDSGTVTPSQGGAVVIWPRGYKWEDKCNVYYMNSYQLNTAPTFGRSTSGC